jgi:predicted DNA-binding transcriptional regulator AlpA
MCFMDTQQKSLQPVDQLLRIQDVVALTTLSKSCIKLWVAQDRFPEPTALSATLKVWRSSDINNWMDAQFGQKEGGVTMLSDQAPMQARSAISPGTVSTGVTMLSNTAPTQGNGRMKIKEPPAGNALGGDSV